MTNEANTFLAIVREANRHNVVISPEMGEVLKTTLNISKAELAEIGKILKADERELRVQNNKRASDPFPDEWEQSRYW